MRKAILLTVSLGLLAAPFVAIGAIDKEKAPAPAEEKAENGQRGGVVAEREKAQREYREMRERRREALLAAARRSSGEGAVGVPGWRGSGDSSTKLVEVAMAAGIDEETGTEVSTSPGEELPAGQSFFLLLVAAGVFLCLTLRFVRPDWFYALRLRNIARLWGAIRDRHREETEQMERGPITVKLRPREKRRLRS